MLSHDRLLMTALAAASTAVCLVLAVPVQAATITEAGVGTPGPRGLASTYVASMPDAPASGGFTQVDAVPRRLGAFDIVINPGSTLASNQPALAAFNRAAARWESFIADPITVTIDADLASLGANTLGQASSVTLETDYSTVRNSVVADASDELTQTNGFDDTIATFLPTAANFSADIPSGTSLSGNLSGTKANLKALGFSGLDTTFGATDAFITFNTAFSFDFDNRDGVNGTDFETVALHEIGHALGFISVVDQVNDGESLISPTILDLYRFTDDTADDPESFAEFTTAPRQLTPGIEAIFDEIDNEVQFSTGVETGNFPNVDGQQGSHWKDASPGTRNRSPVLLGVLDPTLAPGQVFPITKADLRAFDLIGYEIAFIPEPVAATLMLLASTPLLRRRRAA